MAGDAECSFSLLPVVGFSVASVPIWISQCRAQNQLANMVQSAECKILLLASVPFPFSLPPHLTIPLLGPPHSPHCCTSHPSLHLTSCLLTTQAPPHSHATSCLLTTQTPAHSHAPPLPLAPLTLHPSHLFVSSDHPGACALSCASRTPCTSLPPPSTSLPVF